jgi:hypothetical protein
MRGYPQGAAPHLAAQVSTLATGSGVPVVTPAAELVAGTGPLFFAVEVEVYRPGATPAGENGWLARARMADRPAGSPIESTEILRASDLSYRTREGDAGGVQVYPPILSGALEIDRHLPLSPLSAGNAAGWGSIRLTNARRQLDAVTRGRNSDGRPVRILAGRKRRDPARGYDVDPPRSALLELFTGLALPWVPGGEMTIPLRDATYWLDSPAQQGSYGGTGGYDGTQALKGRSRPRARGGSAALPIRDCTPVWCDPVNLIGQLSDAPGIILGCSENGDPAQILPEAGGAQVVDLTAGGTTPGHYRWCSRPDGVFVQLGSPTQGTVTFDVVGHFPSGAQASTAAQIARLMLLEDLALPPAMLDQASLLGLNAACPWTAGDYWDGSQPIRGKDAVGLFLNSVGAKLFPARSGRLRAFPVRPLPVGTRPAVVLTTAEIIDCTRNSRLSEGGLYPPPYRWRVGWGRCNTVQTSSLDPDLTADRRAFLAQELRIAPWASAAVLAAYRRPSDPDVVPTRLLSGTDAAALAGLLGGMWSGERAPALYDVTLRLPVALAREIGDPVVLAYPMDDLDAGRLGQVVGETTRTGDTTAILQVLIG